MGIQTSASVAFKGDANLRLALETDSDASLRKAAGISYVRVYPTFAKAKVTAVKGTAVKIATNIAHNVTDYVSFSGSASSSLRYSAADGAVVTEPQFLGTQPAIVYDEASNSIVLDRVAYGICKVTYVAYFDRYIVNHGNAPCTEATTQTTGGTEPKGTDAPSYEPAFLVAESAGWETAALEVSGPPCSQGEEGLSKTQAYSDYEAVGLKMEVDVEVQIGFHPLYFNANSTPNGFSLRSRIITVNGIDLQMYCGCRIRVYPKTSITLTGVNCAVGTTPLKSGSKPVLQSLVFSGTQSTNLDYPPSSAVTLAKAGLNSISNFGENVDVELRGPGSWVNEVAWSSRNTYELAQGARTVRADEVVVVTSLGSNTIPCYTFGQARYTSDYNVYDMLFSFDDQLGWYAPAMILAMGEDGKVTSLQLEPPSQGGVL